MSGDYARWLANETAAYLTHDTPACPVCRDTGIVQCAEQDGTGMYETACPERVHDDDAEYVRQHGGDDLETGHTRDPEGEEAAAAGSPSTPLDDWNW